MYEVQDRLRVANALNSREKIQKNCALCDRFMKFGMVKVMDMRFEKPQHISWAIARMLILTSPS